MKKRLLTGLLAIGMTMTLAACGSEAATQEAATETAAEATEADTETTEAADDVSEEAGMDPEAENETIQATLTYMGGLYVNGNPDNDMELAIFRNEDGNVIYVIYELGTLNYGFYTTEDATTEDGRTYEKVLVDEKTTYGYYFNEDLESGILIGTDGTVYDAIALDESVARDLVKTTITGQ